MSLINMFSRIELSQLTGLEYEMTRSLERRKIITSKKGKYNYNQIIFGRVLRQIQIELNLPSIVFSDAFGVDPQSKIDFVNRSLIFLINLEHAMIPHIAKDDVKEFEDHWNEFLDHTFNEAMGETVFLPNKEIISFNNGDNPSGTLVMESLVGGAKFMGDVSFVIIPLFRVREAIELKAEEMSISSKIEQTKLSHFDNILIDDNVLVN